MVHPDGSRLKGNEDRRFDEFFRDRWPRAVRLAFVLTGSQAGAEDVAQDAFASLQRRFDDIDSPGAYLRSAIVNLASSHHRRTNRHERALRNLNAAVTTEHHPHELLDAVDRLPYREKAVLVLRYYEDLPEADIAAALGCRPATVRTVAARGLRRLRKEVER